MYTDGSRRAQCRRHAVVLTISINLSSWRRHNYGHYSGGLEFRCCGTLSSSPTQLCYSKYGYTDRGVHPSINRNDTRVSLLRKALTRSYHTFQHHAHSPRPAHSPPSPSTSGVSTQVLKCCPSNTSHLDPTDTRRPSPRTMSHPRLGPRTSQSRPCRRWPRAAVGLAWASLAVRRRHRHRNGRAAKHHRRT